MHALYIRRLRLFTTHNHRSLEVPAVTARRFVYAMASAGWLCSFTSLELVD